MEKQIVLELKKKAFKRKYKKNYCLKKEWFVGFFEAEGSFITVNGYPRIEVCQHLSDKVLFYALKDMIGGGSVTLPLKRNLVVYRLTNQKCLKKLCFLFDQYLFLSKKKAVYFAWRKLHFPDLPKKAQKPLSPHWLCGFTDGDGSFHGILRKQKDYKCGFQISLVFDLTQKTYPGISLDFQKICTLLGAGKFSESQSLSGICHLKITNLKSLNFVILFFKKYPLHSRKSLDFFLFTHMFKIFSGKINRLEKGYNLFLFLRNLQRGVRQGLVPQKA